MSAVGGYVAGYLWLTGQLQDRLLWGIDLPEAEDNPLNTELIEQSVNDSAEHPQPTFHRSAQRFHQQRRRRGWGHPAILSKLIPNKRR